MLKELRDTEVKNLLEAASIIDVAMRETQGYTKIILNNAMAHLMARVYQNGYVPGNGIY